MAVEHPVAWALGLLSLAREPASATSSFELLLMKMAASSDCRSILIGQLREKLDIGKSYPEESREDARGFEQI